MPHPTVTSNGALLESSRITVEALDDLMRKLFEKMGLRTSNAATVSAALVQADLRGIHSHGVALAAHYIERLKTGSIKANPNITVESLGTCVARLDGDGGMGHLAMSAAAEHATSLAKNHGAGWVAVKNSNHCGALPFYGLKVAAAGCVGFVITHTDPIMLPFGSKEAFLGTNPLCVAFPDSDGRPFCLDMSTSIVAWNRILAARRENRPLEGGWAVDADGKDTRDPHAARALLPAAAHKGSGLAVMIDLICAVLTGMPFGADLPHMLAVRETRHLGGHVGALKLASFGDDRALRSQVREYAERMRALIPLEAGASVKYPGEIEEARTRQYSAEGIPLLPSTLMELQRLAATYGVPWLC